MRLMDGEIDPRFVVLLPLPGGGGGGGEESDHFSAALS
jgi:hypothetical protein